MRRFGSWIGAAVLGGSLLVSGVAAARNEGEGQHKGQQQARGNQNQPLAIPAGEIAENPRLYFGKQVSVKAEVEDVIGPKAFTLDEERWFAGPDVLVLVPGTAPLREDANVTVVGTVRPFVVTEIERDYTWFRGANDVPDLVVRYRNRPVIIAQSIRSDNGEELVQTADAQKNDRQPVSGDTDQPNP